MSVIVRALKAEDHAAWLPLWRAYCEFYRTEVADDVTAETFRRVSSGDGIFGLGAELDGRLCGICHYLFHPVTWAVAQRCYLEDLYVAPEARGRGAGRALIEAVYAAADNEGADQVYWLTHEENSTARRLYDTLGEYKGMIKYRWRR